MKIQFICLASGSSGNCYYLGTETYGILIDAGMEAQMKSLANEGVLGNFVGMLTDSRSFLSYTRHEYFRRIMCNVLSEYVENGEYAWDEEILGGIATDLSYYNAKRYFGF